MTELQIAFSGPHLTSKMKKKQIAWQVKAEDLETYLKYHETDDNW